MSDKEIRFEKRHINEQTAYLKDIFELMRIEIHGTDALRNADGRKPMPKRTGMSFEEWEASLEAILQRKKKEALLRKTRFEERLREKPQSYPLGVLYREARLNAFERYAVAATAAVAMFNRHDFRSFDVRMLASLYHSSHIKRLDAELYFRGDCKLTRTGLIEIENDRRGLQVFERDIRIGHRAYLAILGKGICGGGRGIRTPGALRLNGFQVLWTSCCLVLLVLSNAVLYGASCCPVRLISSCIV